MLDRHQQQTQQTKNIFNVMSNIQKVNRHCGVTINFENLKK